MSELHIVTGASKGIGNKIAQRLAERDKKVITIARSENKLEELREKYPARIIPYPLDLLDTSALENFYDYLEKKDYKVKTLVNNAGLLRKGELSDSDDEDWQLMFDIHVMAPVRLIRGLLNRFAKPSHVVNISSMAGFQGSSKFSGMAAYSTAKGALAVASEALAADLKDKQIRCNALCIGAVQTVMLEEAFPGFDAPVSARQMGTYIADFALDAGELFNGQIIPVNINNPE